MKNFLKENWFKIVAILFLLIALADLPYGYFQFLKWVVLASAGYTAYLYYQSKKKVWVFVFGIIVLLFNPIFRFYFSRETWCILDVIVAIIFFVSLFIKDIENKNK